MEQSNAEMLGSVSAVGREAVIVQPLEDVVVREGKIATFLAQIAPSNLSVEWYHNGVPILPNEQIKIYRDGGWGTAIPTRSQSGSVASSRSGFSVSQSFRPQARASLISGFG